MLYRVWNVVHRALDAGPGPVRRLLFSVGSPSEACGVIRLLGARREEDSTVLGSEFGLEVLSAGRWSEWHDHGGRDVMHRVRTSADE